MKTIQCTRPPHHHNGFVAACRLWPVSGGVQPITISYFTSTHRRTIHRKSSNSYQNSIFERVSKNSSNQETFNTAKFEYEVWFFLQEKHEADTWREDFGFKLKSIPAQCEHMEAFEKEFLNTIPNIKFRFGKDTFQKKLKKDIPKIKQSPNLFCLRR